MADNISKAVLPTLLDTWSRGSSVLGTLDMVSGGRSDLGPVVRGGDSVDVPNKSGSTVNTSESGSVGATTIGTPDTLTVNRPKFINEAISQAQRAQLLGGNDNFTRQMLTGMSGDLLNALDKDLVDYLITSVASSSVDYHINLAADAVTNDDVEDCEAQMREQDGIANTGSGLFWMLNPRAAGAIKKVTEFVEVPRSETDVGRGMVAMINGIPAFYNNAVPGRVDSLRQQTATSAVTVASNVATATVPSGHGFVAGQMIWTSGLTTNITEASPVAITSVTATTIVYALTAADGALADGVGTIYSASSMAMLCYAPWIYYGLDGVVPFFDLVKREANAGFTAQLFHHFGRVAHAGSVAILHAPD